MAVSGVRYAKKSAYIYIAAELCPASEYNSSRRLSNYARRRIEINGKVDLKV
jgi:hypothetical protein